MMKISMTVLGLTLTFTVPFANAKPVKIELPADTSTLRESTLPGYTIALQKCGICHSADYISFQPPGMNLVQWTAEMSKMQHSYGAPLNEEEIGLLGAYLAVSYGSAKATDADVQSLSAAASASANDPAASESEEAIDVQALLAANACLGCHAIDHKVVGPGFNEVAAKYESEGDAPAILAGSIRQGGVGKWGQVPMPPMSGLSDAQLQAVVDFILEQ
jgi:cytochrome c551/c552